VARHALILTVLLHAPVAAQTLAIENVHVVPLDEARVLYYHAVTVEDGTIASVLPMAQYVPPADALRIDGREAYLLPGLVDAHVHLEEDLDARPGFGDAPVFLAHGITSVINLRGFPAHLALRERIVTGELTAPTLYTSGEFVNEPRVDSPAEVAAEVHAQAQAGYDLLKFREVVEHGVGVLTRQGMDRDTFLAMHDAARELNLPVIGHGPHGLGLGLVLETGHSFSHLGELIQLHFFPHRPPLGFRVYLLALGLLAAILVGGLSWRLLSRRPPVPGAWRLKGGSALLLLPGAGALVLLFMLLPGGLYYGEWPLIGLFALLLVVLVALGLRYALLAARGKSGSPALRVGFALLALCSILAGGFGLAQGLPAVLRATDGEMQRVAARLAESGAYVCTTLVIYDEFGRLRATGSDARVSSEIADRLSPGFRERYYLARAYLAERRWSDLLTVEGLIPRYHDFTRELAGALHRAGVPLLAGTSAFGTILAPPGPTLHAELELLVAAGLSPYEALRTATTAPARFLGRDSEFGTIAPGMRADLLLLGGDPLADLGALHELRGVVLRGRWLSRESLDEMLAALD
jgi:hypothetical protein